MFDACPTFRKKKDAPVLACLVIQAEALIFSAVALVFGVHNASRFGLRHGAEGIKILVTHGLGAGKFPSNLIN